MDLWNLIPQNDPWIISKDIVYIKYIAKIPILIKRGDDVFVFFDKKICKYVIKLVKILVDNDVDFYFRSTLVFFDNKFTEEETHTLNIKQQLVNICQKEFFYGFQKIGVDFTQILTRYISKYQCHNEFKNIYEDIKKNVLSKEYDWWTNISNYKYDENIRDYISSLERDIKVAMLF